MGGRSGTSEEVYLERHVDGGPTVWRARPHVHVALWRTSTRMCAHKQVCGCTSTTEARLSLTSTLHRPPALTVALCLFRLQVAPLEYVVPVNFCIDLNIAAISCPASEETIIATGR